jgi:hypothetical protein
MRASSLGTDVPGGEVFLWLFRNLLKTQKHIEMTQLTEKRRNKNKNDAITSENDAIIMKTTQSPPSQASWSSLTQSK